MSDLELLRTLEAEMSRCGNEHYCLYRFNEFMHNLSKDEKRRILFNAVNIYKTRIKQIRIGARGRVKHRSHKHRSHKHRSHKHRSHKHRSHKHRRPHQRKTIKKR